MMSQSPALRRLQHDYKNLLKAPLPNVVAQPIEGNLFKWAVNMVATEGVWQGLVVHMHMDFPPTYPKDPPDVSLKTDLSGHPNVFGQWICLDMLKDPGMYSRPYQGWSSAYTLTAILTQLVGFLLVDESIDQMHGASTKRCEVKQGAGKRRCDCPFHDLPPAALEAAASTSAAALEVLGAATPSAPAADRLEAVALVSSGNLVSCSAAGGLLCCLGHEMERLDDHLLRSVLGNLGPVELHHCQAAGGRVARVARDVLQRSELVCFHTKLDYTQALLGFGVSRAYHHDLHSVRGLSAKTDYLSWQAFQQGVRKSAWNVSFDAFLPLYLNPEHGKRALAELPHFTRGICTPSCQSGRLPSDSATPPAVELLQVLALLINSLVVEMVGGTIANASPGVRTPILEVTRAMSDAALQAFCHLHHLLLAVSLQPGSQILSLARLHVTRFLRDPAHRSKQQCPDLGVLLVDYLLVPREEVPWDTFAPLYLREVLARQVRWAIKAEGNWFGKPGSEEASEAADYRRLKSHFESGIVGLRLVMLQAWFANALARPSRTATMTDELSAIKTAYDECSGLPPTATFDAFNRHARSVMKCGSWMQALSTLRLGFSASTPTPRETFAAILRQAVVDSYRAGYHRHCITALGMKNTQVFIDWDTLPLKVINDVWI